MPSASRVTVTEGCPASVLAAKGWPKRGYKGAGDPPRRVREELVRRLAQEGVAIPVPMGEEAIRDEEGDLLDAMLLVTPPFQSVVTADAALEGWVY
jgi:hypothetical protein